MLRIKGSHTRIKKKKKRTEYHILEYPGAKIVNTFKLLPRAMSTPLKAIAAQVDPRRQLRWSLHPPKQPLQKSFLPFPLALIIRSKQFGPRYFAEFPLVLIGLRHLSIRRPEKRPTLISRISVIDHPEIAAGVEKSRTVSIKQNFSVC